MLNIERGGSEVTHDTRIRAVPWFKCRGRPTVEVFSGFLNLKIAKELTTFKGKCRVGPHIPLLMIQFNVSRDLKPLLSKWRTSAFLSAPADDSVI